MKHILDSAFTILDNYQLKIIAVENYRLFQAADIITTLELAGHKITNGTYSQSEKKLLGDAKDFKKGYLRLIKKKYLTKNKNN